MTDILTVILLAIVEGVTEFLPVSSTGHLILAGALLHYDAARWEVFNIVIQLGAILAIVVLYWRTFAIVLTGLARREPAAIRFTRNLIVAFLPAAVLGIALHKKIEALLLPRLRELQAAHPVIGDVRGRGAMLAIELVGADGEPAATAVSALIRHGIEHGVVLLSAGTYGNVLRFLPNLATSDALLLEALDVLQDGLATLDA